MIDSSPNSKQKHLQADYTGSIPIACVNLTKKFRQTTRNNKFNVGYFRFPVCNSRFLSGPILELTQTLSPKSLIHRPFCQSLYELVIDFRPYFFDKGRRVGRWVPPFKRLEGQLRSGRTARSKPFGAGYRKTKDPSTTNSWCGRDFFKLNRMLYRMRRIRSWRWCYGSRR